MTGCAGFGFARGLLLGVLLRIISRYGLPVVPDELLIFPATGMDEQVAAKYYQHFGFSDAARHTVERLLAEPPSARALESLVRFVREAGFSSNAVLATLRTITADAAREMTVRADALQILAARGEPNGFFDALLNDALLNDVAPALARQAFGTLVERQDRATIERELAGLLNNDAALRAGEVAFPHDSPLGWIGKIRERFAWDKLRRLRERALRLELDRVTTILTECLAQIDRPGTARLIRQQMDATPPAWRHYLQARAIEHERLARIEQAQRTPFDAVLQKLRGSTSADRFLVVCEGATDEPVFRALLAQIPDVPGVVFDFVGGWPALVNKDAHSFLRGAKEAIVVMDGDNGRKLNKARLPLTDMAREQQRRLNAAGVELRVFQRHGIENYFPREALEAVLQMDLRSYFPLPPGDPVTDGLSEGGVTRWFRFRKSVARLLRLPAPRPTRSFYSKGRNCDVVSHINLARDLAGTDLSDIIHEIAEKARIICRE